MVNQRRQARQAPAPPLPLPPPQSLPVPSFLASPPTTFSDIWNVPFLPDPAPTIADPIPVVIPRLSTPPLSTLLEPFPQPHADLDLVSLPRDFIADFWDLISLDPAAPTPPSTPYLPIVPAIEVIEDLPQEDQIFLADTPPIETQTSAEFLAESVCQEELILLRQVLDGRYNGQVRSRWRGWSSRVKADQVPKVGYEVPW